MVCECQFDPGRFHNQLCITHNVWCFLISRMLSYDVVMSHDVISYYPVEQDDPEDACGENCLNRLLMIEW